MVLIKDLQQAFIDNPIMVTPPEDDPIPISDQVRYLMGGSNDASGFMLSQIQAAYPRKMQGFQITQRLPAGTPARRFDDLEITRTQYEAMKMSGFLEPAIAASHFSRADTPDGLSALARGVLQSTFRKGDPIVFIVNRKITEREMVAGTVEPVPVHGTFEQNVEVLQALKDVRAALGLDQQIDEATLIEGRTLMLAGTAPLAQASGTLTGALIAAANVPLGKSRVSAMIRKYVDTKVQQAVEKATPHLPRNEVDGDVLFTVNTYAGQIGQTSIPGWPDVSDEIKADVQRQGWDQWANQRAYEMAKKRAHEESARIYDEQARKIANGRLLSRQKLPAVTLSNGDTLTSTYEVVMSDADREREYHDEANQQTVDEVAVGDTGFDIGKALEAAFEGAPP